MCKEIRSLDCIFGNIVPDYTFVFGDYYKKLLTEKGGYEKDSVISTGNLSLMNLDKIRKNYNRKDMLEQKQIPDEKIILVPLSFRLAYHKNNPDRKILDELYSKLRDSKVVILVRPHPGDSINKEKFKDLFPAKNFLFSENTIMDDLILSDLVVAPPITTISSEAALYEKPILLVNVVDDDMSSYDDIYQEIVRSGIAKFSSLDDLIHNVELIKKGELWNTNKSEKRIEFLKSYYNKIGRAHV